MKKEINKIKIFGIGAAVLLLMMAFMPAFSATNGELNPEKEIIILPVPRSVGEGEEEETPECDWIIESTETHDEDHREMPGKFGHWGMYYALLNLESHGGVVTGDSFAYDESTYNAYISGAVTSTKQIHIFRECPPGATDDCCYSIKIELNPRFTLKVTKEGNARAEAYGKLSISSTSGESLTIGDEAISIGSLEGSEFGINVEKEKISGNINIKKFQGDSKEMDYAEAATWIIEGENDLYIDIVGIGALSVAADGYPWGWPFPDAVAYAFIEDWSLGISISTRCDCESEEWKPLTIPYISPHWNPEDWEPWEP